LHIFNRVFEHFALVIYSAVSAASLIDKICSIDSPLWCEMHKKTVNCVWLG